MKPAINKVCKACGSDNVEVNTALVWDVFKQEYVQVEDVNREFCCECGENTTIIEVPCAGESPDLNDMIEGHHTGIPETSTDCDWGPCHGFTIPHLDLLVWFYPENPDRVSFHRGLEDLENE